MKVIQKRKIFLGASLALVVLSIILIGVFGFKEGIDFKGGTLWQFEIKESTPPPTELETFLKNNLPEIGEIRLNYDSENQNFILRFAAIGEDAHQKFSKTIKNAYPSWSELGFQSIGPSVGASLKKNALIAVVLVLVGISLYIAFAFRKTSGSISSWKYGVITLLTLFHDIAIPAGLLAFLGSLGKVEIDSNFIVALLVVMGFSVHDTIVVFDRIRENITHAKSKTEFGDIINESVDQTVARSINTSLTLILVLAAMYLLGPITLKYFILTLLVGVVAGTYSSIFVASPLLYVWHRFKQPS